MENEPTKAELEAIKAEILEERGREVEWDNSEDLFLREKKSYLDRIDQHIIRGGMMI